MKITDRLIKCFEAPEKGNKLYRDTDTTGFCVRVTAAGSRAFVLNYIAPDGRERRMTIGKYPDWSLTAARHEAMTLRRLIDQGIDPLEQKEAVRNAPTVKDLAGEFEDEHLAKKRPGTVRDYKGLIKNHILPAIGNKKVEAIETRDIEKLHRGMKETPYLANRVLAVCSKMFTLAVKWKYRDDNPVKGIERYTEEKRSRYLKPDELQRLLVALNESVYQDSADLIRLLLLTGARFSEVASAAWDQIDLTGAVWTKPSAHTKQKRKHQIPLSPAALELLQRRQAVTGGTGYLFPSDSASGHVTTLKTFWSHARKVAELGDLRIHDLRHSFASFLVSSGHSLELIGALLGHTQPGTTARYAHLMDDPLRRAAAQIGSIVNGGGETAEVVSIGARK